MYTNYSIVAVFDEESQLFLNKARNYLNINGIKCNPSISHITIARYYTNRKDLLLKKVKSFTSDLLPFEIELSVIERFINNNNNTIYLKPNDNENLTHLHKLMLDYLSNINEDLNKYYDLENWVPHCTLALKLSKTELDKGINILSNYLKLPIKVRIEKIDIL